MDRFSFSFLGKTAIRKTGNSLVVPDIHHPGPTPFPHSLACNPDLSKSARSVLRIRDHVSTFWVSRNQCHDVRTLLLAKELVGNREAGRRLDNLHNSLVLHWTPSVKYNCMPLDTNGSGTTDGDPSLRFLQEPALSLSKGWAAMLPAQLSSVLHKTRCVCLRGTRPSPTLYPAGTFS